MVLHYPARKTHMITSVYGLQNLTVPTMWPFLIASQWLGDFLFCRDTAPCWLVCTKNFAVNCRVATLVNASFNAHHIHQCTLWHSHHHGHQFLKWGQLSWTRDGPQLHWPANVAVCNNICKNSGCIHSLDWTSSYYWTVPFSFFGQVPVFIFRKKPTILKLTNK